MPDLNTTVNQFSWSEVSNLLFLSQPLGVGFSHGSSTVDTSQAAAEAAWQVLQAVMSTLPEMKGNITSRAFNLWTERCGVMHLSFSKTANP